MHRIQMHIIQMHRIQMHIIQMHRITMAKKWIFRIKMHGIQWIEYKTWNTKPGIQCAEYNAQKRINRI
jgi:hypothetical protein